MVKSLGICLLVTPPFDQIWSWLAQYWGEILAVIIGGAILSMMGYLIDKARRPRLVLEPKVRQQFDDEKKQLIKAWTILWDIHNTGSVSAKRVTLRLHIIDFANVLAGNFEEESLTIFRERTIVPERKQQELPMAVTFSYPEEGEKVIMSPFQQGFVTHFLPSRGAKVFSMKRSVQYPLGGLLLTFQFSGDNLEDDDSISRSWVIFLPPEKGMPPTVKPFTRPPPMEMPSGL